jgi:glycosyltransferase involved in cell wall biosynthesis
LSAPELHLVVPGPLDQLTGGYVYDARMVDGLRALGWTVSVHSLEGAFPAGDSVAEASLARTLADLPARARVLIDGLAMGSLPRPVRAHSTRLRILGLVHHPLADETGTSPAEQERLFALEREALSACMGVVVNSAFTAARLADFGVSSERVRVAAPGIDRGPRVVGPLPGDPPALLCVGTITPRKGQDILVRALAHIEPLPWTCVCAGSLTRDHDFVCRVEELVEDGGLEERVRFVGEVRGAALESLYQHASLFALPSHYEGYGMAFAEALVRGLPVVGTTGGAVPYTVPADAGILVPPGDYGALADALAGLLTGDEGSAARARLSDGAWAHGLTLPDWDRAAEVFASAILELAPN